MNKTHQFVDFSITYVLLFIVHLISNNCYFHSSIHYNIIDNNIIDKFCSSFTNYKDFVLLNSLCKCIILRAFSSVFLFDVLIKIVTNTFAVLVSLRIRYFMFLIVHDRMQTMFDLNISIDSDFFLNSMRWKIFWVHIIRCELCI